MEPRQTKTGQSPDQTSDCICMLRGAATKRHRTFAPPTTFRSSWCAPDVAGRGHRCGRVYADDPSLHLRGSSLCRLSLDVHFCVCAGLNAAHLRARGLFLGRHNCCFASDHLVQECRCACVGQSDHGACSRSTRHANYLQRRRAARGCGQSDHGACSRSTRHANYLQRRWMEPRQTKTGQSPDQTSDCICMLRGAATKRHRTFAPPTTFRSSWCAPDVAGRGHRCGRVYADDPSLHLRGSSLCRLSLDVHFCVCAGLNAAHLRARGLFLGRHNCCFATDHLVRECRCACVGQSDHGACSRSTRHANYLQRRRAARGCVDGASADKDRTISRPDLGIAFACYVVQQQNGIVRLHRRPRSDRHGALQMLRGVVIGAGVSMQTTRPCTCAVPRCVACPWTSIFAYALV